MSAPELAVEKGEPPEPFRRRDALFRRLPAVCLGAVAALAATFRVSAPVWAHDTCCALAKPHQPGCSYNCWRYGYGYAWDCGHNWCFECVSKKTGTCWRGPFLCSEWGHM